MDDIEEKVRQLRDKRLEEVRNPDRFSTGEQALIEMVQLDLWLKFNDQAKREAAAKVNERLKPRLRPRSGPFLIG